MLDIHSIDAMAPAPDERIELLVIGGGRAGLAAAIEGALAGLSVVLVDENPIDPVLMGMDVPHMFGQRMTAVVQSSRNMTEQIALSDPRFETALETGVDVRLGVTAWGLFAPSHENQSIDALVAGLSDATKSWTARCDHVIVAAGARDIALGFDGWNQPGVVGALALGTLIHKYDACASRRLLVLGSGTLALQTALDACRKGIDVVGLVEPSSVPQGPDDLVQEVREFGLEIMTGSVILRVDGNAGGITAAIVAALNGDSVSGAGGGRTIACDTVCLAVAQTPNIELLASAGCQMAFDGRHGTWGPATSEGLTTIPRLQAIGDCSGLGRSADTIADEARKAARRAADGTDVAATSEMPATDTGELSPAQRWIEALVETGGLDVLACQCEAVTRAELLNVSPPAYLDARSGPISTRKLRTLAKDGPPHPDQIKRLTRCGMGECQGRRCREQAAMLVARGAGVSLSSMPLASYRAPVRPLPLDVLAAPDETAEMLQGWHGWFGIPTQFTPHWELDGAIAVDADATKREVEK